MEFLETYGLPSKLGRYPAGATDAEKMTLMRAVMSIGRNAGGIMLAEVSPDKDLDALQDDLEKLIFASTVLGRLSVHESRKASQQEVE